MTITNTLQPNADKIEVDWIYTLLKIDKYVTFVSHSDMMSLHFGCILIAVLYTETDFNTFITTGRSCNSLKLTKSDIVAI